MLTAMKHDSALTIATDFVESLRVHKQMAEPKCRLVPVFTGAVKLQAECAT